MAQVAEKLQPWLAALDERPRGGARWLQDLRDQSASRFVELGFPSVRDEEWRFTNVSPIASTEFRVAPAVKLDASALNNFLYADAPLRLVVVNGKVSPELSRTPGLAPGMKFGSLATAAAEQSDVVARYLGQLADPSTRAFAALNTAFVHDGAFLYVPDGVVFERPLQILFVSTNDGSASQPATMSHPRTLIVAGDRSQVQVVETYVSLQGQKHFSNAVTEVVAGENAIVDHYKVEHESIDAFHIASMHIHAARGSNVSTHAFTLGGRIVRNDIVAVLDGEGAECTLNGLYLADGERLVDTHTTIDHAKPHCPSHEVYKGILGGRAKAVFNGKIIVRIDAQKTDAKQTNRALLLSDNATINTKPQLEIFADDVKCTHGAAIGQLDEDAIFYLRARGLTFLEARDMLIHAFAGEILERVKIEPLKAALETELYTQLARDLAEVDAA
jgi:Fe-S cluster assembly protein SufD